MLALSFGVENFWWAKREPQQKETEVAKSFFERRGFFIEHPSFFSTWL
jgi:hypothetical protein